MCGVAGVLGAKDAAVPVRNMLHRLQNRGTDGCGIVTTSINSGGKFHCHRGIGTVSNVLNPDVLSELTGKVAIGHTRYATAKGSTGPENLQPLFFKVNAEQIALVHNGQFTNIAELEAGTLNGTPFNSHSDTERYLRLIIREHRTSDTIEEAVIKATDQMRGSCAAILQMPGKLIAIRDSSGNRPLYWGEEDGVYYIASETSALNSVRCYNWTEVEAGTIISFTKQGKQVFQLEKTQLVRQCTFEHVYFGFPQSTLFGARVQLVRHTLGEIMAKRHPTETDLIVGVPDSAVEMALGYAEGLGRHVDQGVILRHHNTGRTFIQRGQGKRKKAVSDKFAFDAAMVKGKSITLIDDSVVRGTTSRGINEELFACGATAVHWRIPSPRVIASCRYGINTADRSKLLAVNRTIVQMSTEIGATSLEFLGLEDFKVGLKECGFEPDHGCYACMTGKYWQDN